MRGWMLAWSDIRLHSLLSAVDVGIVLEGGVDLQDPNRGKHKTSINLQQTVPLVKAPWTQVSEI